MAELPARRAARSATTTSRSNAHGASAARRRRRDARRGGARVRTCASSSLEALSALELRRLGRSELLVPEVTLGTMTWGKQNSEAEAREQMAWALSQGLRFWDTAEMYPVPTDEETQGRTSEYIGNFLASSSAVGREDVVLATKVCGYSQRLGWWRGGPPTRLSRAQVKDGVEGELRRLQTDYVDLLQLHWPDRYVPLFGAGMYDTGDAKRRDDAVPIEETLEAVAELVEEGKVRALGVSNETSYGVMRFVQAAEQSARLPRICSIQNAYSLLVRSNFETDLVEACHLSDVSLLVYSPLAGGTLSGKYQGEGDGPPDARLNRYDGFMARYRNDGAAQAIDRYCELAAELALSPAQLALAWLKHRSCVTSTIIGGTSVAQLEENLSAWEVALDDEALEAIEAVHRSSMDPSFLL